MSDDPIAFRKIHLQDIEKHEQSLYGNGKEGLTTRVARIEGMMKIILTISSSTLIILIATIIGYITLK